MSVERLGGELTLHRLLAEWEEDHQSQRPDGLTASAVSFMCARQESFARTGVTPSDEVDPVSAATVGSMIHFGVGLLWSKVPGALVELRTDAGTADVVRPAEREVRDLKSVADHRFDRWYSAGGPPDSVWQQVAQYGAAHGADSSWTLVVDAFCRVTGRCETYTRPFTEELAEAGRAKLAELAELMDEVDPMDVDPIDHDGRYRAGDGDWFCDHCPFRDACLGAAGVPDGIRKDLPAIIDAATEYRAAAGMESEGKRRKKAAKLVLEGFVGEAGPWVISQKTMPGRHVDYYAEGYTYPVVKAKGGA